MDQQTQQTQQSSNSVQLQSIVQPKEVLLDDPVEFHIMIMVMKAKI